MTPAEMELQLSGLRRELAQFGADDDARRNKAKRLAYGNFAVAFAFLMFGLVLYLNHNPLHVAFLLNAIVLICLGSNLIALAAPRTEERSPSQ
jgi:heme A synthase